MMRINIRYLFVVNHNCLCQTANQHALAAVPEVPVLHVFTVWSQHSRSVRPAAHVAAAVCVLVLESGREWHEMTLEGTSDGEREGGGVIIWVNDHRTVNNTL